MGWEAVEEGWQAAGKAAGQGWMIWFGLQAALVLLQVTAPVAGGQMGGKDLEAFAGSVADALSWVVVVVVASALAQEARTLAAWGTGKKLGAVVLLVGEWVVKQQQVGWLVLMRREAAAAALVRVGWVGGALVH